MCAVHRARTSWYSTMDRIFSVFGAGEVMWLVVFFSFFFFLFSSFGGILDGVIIWRGRYSWKRYPSEGHGERKGTWLEVNLSLVVLPPAAGDESG
jgi:hypothetical protein